jgi:hypothetical protein
MIGNYRIKLLTNMPQWFVAYINKNLLLCDDFQYTTGREEVDTC